MKTIKQVSNETGVNRVTLQQVARKGTIPSELVGRLWYIDADSEQFKKWLEAHQHQPRVKGAVKQEEKSEK